MGSIRHFLILSTLSLCMFVTSGVKGAMAQDFNFSRIDVDGNKRIETSTIITYSGLATDQVFGADDLNRAYQNILASGLFESCLLYTSPSPRDLSTSRMPSSA